MINKYYFWQKAVQGADGWELHKINVDSIYTDFESAESKVKQMAKTANSLNRYRVRVAFVGDDGKVRPCRGKPHRWWSQADFTKEK